jgi:hypothetical protein
MQPVALPTGALNISIHEVQALPSSGQADGGSIRQVKSHTVLHLVGNATARGFAHGKLLAAQIIQFFRFFTLEETTGSVEAYTQHIIPARLKNYTYPVEYTNEARAMLDGIAASGVDSFIPELGRKMELVDILYLNDYGTYPMNGHASNGWGPVKIPTAVSAMGTVGTMADPPMKTVVRERKTFGCSQFAFWGRATAGTDVAGRIHYRCSR